ncbi:MAG: heat-inducible transcriptional repressor HrcA [Pseudomonadota bacterium]
MQQLDGRPKTVLFNIVAEYIHTGEPVGSRTLSKKSDLGLSAATIRNIMSDLTEWGYIMQPHVSAGRVPTDIGYRFYVNAVLGGGSATGTEEADVRTIEGLLKEAGMDVRDVLRQSSCVLAVLSKKAGVVTAIAPEEQRFKTIDFIKVAEDKVLVVLMSSTGFIQNWIIYDEDGTSQETLERYGRIMNDMLRDLDLRQARERIEQELRSDGILVDAMMAKALRLGHMILSRDAFREVFIEGSTNILDEPEFANIDSLKAILHAFEDKSKLLKILDKTLQATGLQILIGSEHGLGELETCSIIAYPIRAGDIVLASISVIGPKRMNYKKLVPLVFTTGRILTKMARGMVENPL